MFEGERERKECMFKFEWGGDSDRVPRVLCVSGGRKRVLDDV